MKASNWCILKTKRFEAAMAFINITPAECDLLIEWSWDMFNNNSKRGFVGYKADKTTITIFFKVRKDYTFALLRWT